LSNFIINPYLESGVTPIVNQDFSSATGWTLNSVGSGQTISGGSLNSPTTPSFGYMSLTLADTDNWVFQFDMEATGNRDTPYLQLSSDTSSSPPDPTEGNKKFKFFTNNNTGNLKTLFGYYPSGGSFTELNGEDASGSWAKDVVYYCEATRNGDAFTFAQYSSVADRDNRANALQEISFADLNPPADPSAYADTPDFAYIGVGAGGANGEQKTYNLKLWNVYF
jgi:hypothetical protein